MIRPIINDQQTETAVLYHKNHGLNTYKAIMQLEMAV